MKTPAETIRIGHQGRDHLIKLRRQTGIEHWNVLCRIAFCISMREKTTPPPVSDKLEGGVEMTWKVFAGDYADAYAAICWMRCNKDTSDGSQDAASTTLRAHIHRGLAYMAAGKETKSISDLAMKWLLDTPKSDH